MQAVELRSPHSGDQDPRLYFGKGGELFGQPQVVQAGPQTIATTGNTDFLVVAPEEGVIEGIDFASIAALAAHDTNYLTFSATNMGQAGAGSTAMLAATDPNTTKATGGSALTAFGRRQLTLSGTPANLQVAKGDVIRIRAAASGTLAGAVTGATVAVRFKAQDN